MLYFLYWIHLPRTRTMAIVLVISVLVFGASADKGSDNANCTTTPCNATCDNNNNCSCPPGYKLVPPKNRTCTDIDECMTNTSNCFHTCTNTIGGYNCPCPGGLYLAGDGRRCLDICQTKRHNCSHTCTLSNVLSWGFNCSCRDGYTLGNDSTSCTDINECSRKERCLHNCMNTEGSYTCSCHKGFELSPDLHNCTDIDECATNTSNCSHTCNNTIGGYNCSCPRGLYLADDGHRCLDICQTKLHNCSQTCTVSYVSSWGFNCSCRDGYTLGNDNTSCTDIDECLLHHGGCSDSCLNNNGSYTCVCPNGYELTDDHHNCTDKDECEENSDRCNQICVNIIGSYACACWSNSTLADEFSCKLKPTDKEGEEQAIELVVSNMKVEEFTEKIKEEFKVIIAKTVEEHCNQTECSSTTSRKRRNVGNYSISASDVDVVIVQGYPKQHANGKDLLIVFYVVIPTPEQLLPQGTLLSITNDTVVAIAKVLGKTGDDIQLKQYVPVVTTAPPTTGPQTDLWTKIIIGVAVGLVVFVLLLLCIAAFCRRRNKSSHNLEYDYDGDNGRAMRLGPMGEVHQNPIAVGNST